MQCLIYRKYMDNRVEKKVTTFQQQICDMIQTVLKIKQEEIQKPVL
jgi:hypothetical protein